MARYNKTPAGMQLQAQTPGQGGYGGIGTLPNMKAMPQIRKATILAGMI